jgi:hypothetical protein
MHRFALGLAVLFASLLPADLLAWNHTGHRVSACIAYRQLDPAVRQKVDSILQAHPRYQDDLLAGLPPGHANPAEWAFMTAATWPDMLRSPAHPMNQRHHRPVWHYVNIPFVQPGDDPSDLQVAPAGPLELLPGAEPQNVVQALHASVQTLQSPASTPTQRAIALCWYLHLAGDVHQPLHAATRFSLQFPDGDRGGNQVIFQVGDEPMNLHAYWDTLLGEFDQPGVLTFLADLLRTGHRDDAIRRQADDLSYRNWARESFRLGVREVYLQGDLRGATRPPNPRATTSSSATTSPAATTPASPVATVARPTTTAAVPPPLPAGYNDNARRVGARQLTLAGHRMAADLNQLLRPRPTTAPAEGR